MSNWVAVESILASVAGADENDESAEIHAHDWRLSASVITAKTEGFHVDLAETVARMVARVSRSIYNVGMCRTDGVNS